jgi:hypothetical protein
MSQRSTKGRALFYTRDSGGKHETTPGEYVRWAQREVAKHGLRFDGTPERIEAMIRQSRAVDGDLFLHYVVSGNQLSRPALDALFETARYDANVSHVLIPRRDRFARPDDPIDAINLETGLRVDGLTLVFIDKVIPPIQRGSQREIAELVVDIFDYHKAGKFRRDLAQTIINSQIALARDGFSTGGRPPYGFRRWLVRHDGTPVRELAEGERVKMAGHHVAWFPTAENELAVCRRILGMLETMPATRVATALTSEGVPAPDTGRRRKDRGFEHPTSGVWHQTTIVNVARNPLIGAVVTYGRRSMGDQLRFTPDGPRQLDDTDYRPDGKPKVVANPAAVRVDAPARFEPVVDPERHRRLQQTLDERGGSQRRKPRSRDPRQNPLGARIFDMACGWPMYREPYSGSFRYTCGLYQQSHGAKCLHNFVGGPMATRFLLNAVRQRVLAPVTLAKLQEKLRRLAEAEHEAGPAENNLSAKKGGLKEVERKLAKASENMAMAENPDQFRAIADVFERLKLQKQTLEREIAATKVETSRAGSDPQAEAAAALAQLDSLGDLAGDAENIPAIGELFGRLNVRLYLRFREEPWGKRTVNRVAGGVVRFGVTPPPVALYDGPTSRRQVLEMKTPSDSSSGGVGDPYKPCISGREGGSLGNVNRDGGI